MDEGFFCGGGSLEGVENAFKLSLGCCRWYGSNSNSMGSERVLLCLPMVNCYHLGVAWSSEADYSLLVKLVL